MRGELSSPASGPGHPLPRLSQSCPLLTGDIASPVPASGHSASWGVWGEVFCVSLEFTLRCLKRSTASLRRGAPTTGTLLLHAHISRAHPTPAKPESEAASNPLSGWRWGAAMSGTTPASPKSGAPPPRAPADISVLSALHVPPLPACPMSVPNYAGKGSSAPVLSCPPLFSIFHSLPFASFLLFFSYYFFKKSLNHNQVELELI